MRALQVHVRQVGGLHLVSHIRLDACSSTARSGQRGRRGLLRRHAHELRHAASSVWAHHASVCCDLRAHVRAPGLAAALTEVVLRDALVKDGCQEELVPERLPALLVVAQAHLCRARFGREVQTRPACCHCCTRMSLGMASALSWCAPCVLHPLSHTPTQPLACRGHCMCSDAALVVLCESQSLFGGPGHLDSPVFLDGAAYLHDLLLDVSDPWRNLRFGCATSR